MLTTEAECKLTTQSNIKKRKGEGDKSLKEACCDRSSHEQMKKDRLTEKETELGLISPPMSTVGLKKKRAGDKSLEEVCSDRSSHKQMEKDRLTEEETESGLISLPVSTVGLKKKGATKSRKKRTNGISTNAVLREAEPVSSEAVAGGGARSDSEIQSDLGSRPKRHRMPPTLYWLGQRVQYRELGNGLRETVRDEPVKSTGPVEEKEELPSKRRKTVKARKDQGPKIRPGKASKRKPAVNKTPEPVDTPGPEDSLSPPSLNTQPRSGISNELSDDAVLVCPSNDVIWSNKNAGLVSETDKVKTARCVWSDPVKGGLLELNVNASSGLQIANRYKAVYYVESGEVSYENSQGNTKLSAGSFFVVPHGEKYNIVNISRVTTRLVVCQCKV